MTFNLWTQKKGDRHAQSNTPAYTLTFHRYVEFTPCLGPMGLPWDPLPTMGPGIIA